MPVPTLPPSPPAWVAGLFNAQRPSRIAPCPDAPAATFVTNAPACPALEVTGRIGPDGARLDPAFDLLVPSAALARDRQGNATLTGYAASGDVLFTQSFMADGDFHIDVPLAPARAQAIRRLSLVTGAGNAERSSTAHGEPTAETVATGDRQVLFAWNARQFPAIRVTAENDPTATSYLSGSSTFEQATIGMDARRLVVDFSDGVRSVARRVVVLGR